MGFKPSAIDQCAHLKDEAIIVCYVEDCIIFAKDKRTINTVYNQLKDRKLVFDEEGDVSECIGIKIKHKKDGSMILSQPCLIRKIIENIPGMMDYNPRETPSMPSVALAKDLSGKPRKGTWSYRSAIGMMNFVA